MTNLEAKTVFTAKLRASRTRSEVVDEPFEFSTKEAKGEGLRKSHVSHFMRLSLPDVTMITACFKASDREQIHLKP